MGLELGTLPVLLAAAFAAGVVNSIAGGGTFLTFGALVWAGAEHRAASATSALAVLPGIIGSAWGYRRDLEGTRQALVLSLPAMVAGGAIGAALLVVTPASSFKVVAPYLVLFATALFALQDRFRAVALRREGKSRAVAAFAYLVVGCYAGYFGAGAAILLLAILLAFETRDIHRANGLKSVLAAANQAVGAVGFVAAGLLLVGPGLVMAAASLAGGYAGARFARRLGRRVVVATVIVMGVITAAALLLAKR